MLIRFGGGVGGIKEYLEEGQKQGRGHSREELDERVILAGDLEAVDALIESLDIAGEKYRHITLSFKEDEVSRELLQDVVREFERFAFAAFRSDEYAFYAEAHLPRLQSYRDAASGGLVERKPHIHIVIPKVNLLSDGHLNPFGLVEQNMKYVDAFQEYINEKYGLTSPKDNRRVEFTSESEMLSRHKGDLFDAQGKEIKSQLLDAILARDIRRYEDFVALVREFGEHRTRNAGRANQYENVKVPGAARGLNLKDFVFQREFIELSADQKRAQLDAELRPWYEAPGPARTSSAERAQLLQSWADVRSKEVKYINAGNRRAWSAYRAADDPGRMAILLEREERFYAKHDRQQERADGRAGRTDPGRDPTERGHGRDQEWDQDFPFKGEGRGPGRRRGPRDEFGGGVPSLGQHDLGSAPTLAQAESLDGVRDLSGEPVAGVTAAGAVLLPGDAPDQLEHGQAKRADALRRGVAGLPGELSLPAGGPANVAGQLLQDLKELRAGQAGEAAQAWRELKRAIDVQELLGELATTHGVVIEKYEVTEGRDGGGRVKCGGRHLNVSDFLTRELHLPWGEAERILREAHARQRGLESAPAPRIAPTHELWRQFMQRRRMILAVDRAAGRHQAKLDSVKGRAAITRAFQVARTNAGQLPPSQRRAQISVARMTRLVAEAELRERLRQQRVQQRAKGRRSDLELYRDFLQEKGQVGDELALRELRRMAIGMHVPEVARAGNSIVGPPEDGPSTRRHAFYSGEGLTFSVEANGDVIYKVAGARVIRDSARKVDVLLEDARTLETALRLAQAKFAGSTLTLNGSRRFQDRVARSAAEHGVGVRFTDERLNQVMRAHRVELDAARTQQKPPGKGLDRS